MSKDFNRRLVLGTAQLGMPYGIANRTGQPDQPLANSIIREAWTNGIQEFDTAQGYGISESVLGKAFSALEITEKVRVISKFDPEINHLNSEVMRNTLDASLNELKVPKLYGVLLHHQETMTLWEKGLKEICQAFIDSEKVQYMGVSVYSPTAAIKALNAEGIDLIQLPSNILDRRFEQADIFRIAKEKGKQIYIRSAFLQGLILMSLDKIPDHMGYVKPVLQRLDQLRLETGLTSQEIALGYMKMEMPDAQIVLGVEEVAQLKQNLESWEKIYSSSLIPKIKAKFENVDETILNPVLWPSNHIK
jgi:aryl-alcohol dehydrogenase-like predicted oxidoreductase